MSELSKSNSGAPPGRSGIVRPPPGVRDVFSVVLEAVTAGISGAKLAARPLLEAISEVVLKTVRESAEMGGDRVPGIKAILMGVLQSAGEKGEAGLKILSHTARIVIRHTAELEGDLGAAIKGLVLGAIASARSLEIDSAQAASRAAQGALEGAAEAGSGTVDRVMEALKQPMGGIKVAFTKPS